MATPQEFAHGLVRHLDESAIARRIVGRALPMRRRIAPRLPSLLVEGLPPVLVEHPTLGLEAGEANSKVVHQLLCPHPAIHMKPRKGPEDAQGETARRNLQKLAKARSRPTRVVENLPSRPRVTVANHCRHGAKAPAGKGEEGNIVGTRVAHRCDHKVGPLILPRGTTKFFDERNIGDEIREQRSREGATALG